MEKLEFRKLRADEIDCRVNTINEKGLTLLLYKDARCDMNILDETVGCMNWQREHTRENANCIVSIYNEDTNQWISKEDTGTESFTEKEKGLASDSFKRACFNWGIGRELYTSPFIWISKDDCNITQNPKDNTKYTTYDTFKVSTIGYNTYGEIDVLNIINTKTNKIVFKYNQNKKESTKEPTYREQLIAYCKEKKLDTSEISKDYNLTKDSTEEDYKKALTNLKVGE